MKEVLMPIIELTKSSGTKLRVLPILLAFTVVSLVPVAVFGKSVVEWDFTRGTQGWMGNNRVGELTSSPEGLLVKCTGEDPWIEGPAVDLPGDKMIRVKIRMNSNADTSVELFYGALFRAGHSVRFTARNDGQWHEYSLVIREKLERGTRFRLDPCAGAGEITIAFIKVEAIGEIVVPSLEKPKRPGKTRSRQVSVKSGNLEFEHYGSRWENFVLKVNGIEMASGYQCELLGVVFDESSEWLNLKNAKVTFENRPEREEFKSKAVIKDSRGATWEIQESVRPAEQEGALVIKTELKVNKARDIIHIPWLTIFPGLGTFGERKYQGLFAGVEYLCDEPSSSEADIETPEHLRLVP